MKMLLDEGIASMPSLDCPTCQIYFHDKYYFYYQTAYDANGNDTGNRVMYVLDANGTVETIPLTTTAEIKNCPAFVLWKNRLYMIYADNKNNSYPNIAVYNEDDKQFVHVAATRNNSYQAKDNIIRILGTTSQGIYFIYRQNLSNTYQYFVLGCFDGETLDGVSVKCDKNFQRTYTFYCYFNQNIYVADPMDGVIYSLNNVSFKKPDGMFVKNDTENIEIVPRDGNTLAEPINLYYSTFVRFNQKLYLYSTGPYDSDLYEYKETTNQFVAVKDWELTNYRFSTIFPFNHFLYGIGNYNEKLTNDKVMNIKLYPVYRSSETVDCEAPINPDVIVQTNFLEEYTKTLLRYAQKQYLLCPDEDMVVQNNKNQITIRCMKEEEISPLIQNIFQDVLLMF